MATLRYSPTLLHRSSNAAYKSNCEALAVTMIAVADWENRRTLIERHRGDFWAVLGS